jgi:hypothetical protein
MTLPELYFAVRWLIRDTLRQARASGVAGAMLLVTAVCTMLCLSVSIQGDPPPIPLRPWEDRNLLPAQEAAKHNPKDLEGIDVPGGELTLLFGTFRVRLARPRDETVHFLQALLAGGVADTAGVLLALIWTAGFLPSFLDPAAASVLLAKPVPRWALLAGKFLGVLLFVAAQALLFVAATWLALGVTTGEWDPRYFVCVPLLLVHFACFFSVSAFLATVTRSTVASVLGTLAFWFVCWGVNYARHATVAAAGGSDLSAGGHLLDAAYWLLPKPADLGLALLDALKANTFFAQLPVFRTLQERGVIDPALSIVTSCLLPVTVFLGAARRLTRAEY